MTHSEREDFARHRDMNQQLEERRARIRQLNDQLRATLVGGYLTITAGVKALGPAYVSAIIIAIQGYAQFNADNDPYDEHDFGAFDVNGSQLFWKIDYYDGTLEFGSPDPADPSVTTRVLTIMLAEEY